MCPLKFKATCSYNSVTEFLQVTKKNFLKFLDIPLTVDHSYEITNILDLYLPDFIKNLLKFFLNYAYLKTWQLLFCFNMKT